MKRATNGSSTDMVEILVAKECGVLDLATLDLPGSELAISRGHFGWPTRFRGFVVVVWVLCKFVV